MKLPVLSASTLLLAAVAALPASATTFDPLNQISFTGGDTFCTPSGSTGCNAGAITFNYTNAVHDGDATGIFAPFVNSTPTFNSFNYLTSTTPFTLITDTYGTQSLIFTVTDLSYTYDKSEKSLSVSGGGYYLLNGTQVEGDFTLTTQGAHNSRVTFSDTNSIAQAPEPASLALLGTGLLGAVGIVRRRLS